MEQKEMIELLSSGNYMTYLDRVEIAVHMNALSERLHQQEAEIEKLVQERGTMRASSPTMEWISVEDRLPGAYGRYISYNGKDIVISYSDPVRPGLWSDEKITHWMPLPEPPKQKEPETHKYRKKPIVVEAYQTDRKIVIPTLEGDMTARRGDYIVTGVDGEQYPCKPDIFAKIYEPYFEKEGEADA